MRAFLPLSAAGLAAVVLVAILLPAGGNAAPIASASAACPNSNKPARSITTAQAEKAILCLINKKRRARGAKLLRNQKALRRAARKHSRLVVREKCISHQCPGEPPLGQRVAAEGYPGCHCAWGVGEAIGWRLGSDSSPRGIVSAWMASPAHRKLLVARKNREAGIGAAWGSPRANHPDDIVAGVFTAVVGWRR